MSTVTFQGVSKRYGEVLAVDNLSLAIEDGEFMVLVGPSGCGKTTSLRMIAGLEDITDGTLSIGDKVVNEHTGKDGGPITLAAVNLKNMSDAELAQMQALLMKSKGTEE